MYPPLVQNKRELAFTTPAFFLEGMWEEKFIRLAWADGSPTFI